LTDAGAADALAALLESPGGSALVGVRHQVEDEPAGWLTRADVMAGIAAVGAAGLVYDLLIVPSQLGEAIDVVRRLPHVTFVLDHAAKPDIAGGRWEPWASGLATLASEPNVHAKLSGLHTQASWTGWTVADLRPYADHMVEAFGTGRVIAGSDWPVCELAVDYASAWATVDALLAGATPAECADIVGRNAELTYGLPPQLSR
ncbi:MAG: hypothetical protein JWM93_614, partial [Frankiales bacterium]|nr:hypothetical protein [Frankiales bacterium]